MAGVRWKVSSGEVTTGTSKLTLQQVTAPANQRLEIDEWSVSFKGTSNTAAPILTEVENQGSGGTGTTNNPTKVVTSDGETLQTTGIKNINSTAQPSVTSVHDQQEVHPQGGYTWQAPFGGAIIVKGGEKFGIAVTAGASVSAIATIKGRE